VPEIDMQISAAYAAIGDLYLHFAGSGVRHVLLLKGKGFVAAIDGCLADHLRL